MPKAINHERTDTRETAQNLPLFRKLGTMVLSVASIPKDILVMGASSAESLYAELSRNRNERVGDVSSLAMRSAIAGGSNIESIGNTRSDERYSGGRARSKQLAARRRKQKRIDNRIIRQAAKHGYVHDGYVDIGRPKFKKSDSPGV